MLNFTPTTEADLVADTSAAPWMDIALGEERKGISESVPLADVKQAMQLDLARQTTVKGPHLLDWQQVNRSFADSFAKAAAPAAKAITKAHNPEITKYFQNVTTDPARDPMDKGRSWGVDPVVETEKGWDVTPWCAAFINWCLSQVAAPRLGYATAISWLRYGIPLAHPAYGCVVIVKPSTSTRSTTGHVAFFVEQQGSRLVLLGGNQSNQVKRSRFEKKNVLGYRWPSKITPGALVKTVVV